MSTLDKGALNNRVRRLTKEEARRWIERFEAAEEADREAMRREGPRPKWSVEMALSLIEAARSAGLDFSAAQAGRKAEDEAVRRTWDALRARFRK